MTNGPVIDSSNYLTYLNEITAGMNTSCPGLVTTASLQNRFTLNAYVMSVATPTTAAAR